MKVLGFAIRDAKLEAFLPVFFVRAKGEAMRHFIDAVADPKSPFHKHEGDYALYHVMEFDDVSGRVSHAGDDPVHVMSGLDALASLTGS